MVRPDRAPLAERVEADETYVGAPRTLHQPPLRPRHRARRADPAHHLPRLGRSTHRASWLLTKIHLLAANERMALTFARSPGQAHDAPDGRKLLASGQRRPTQVPMVMDRAYEGDETRHLVLQLGFEAVVPPNLNRLRPGPYDRRLYRRRHEVERLFRRRQRFRRIFPRFEKLDIMFTAFIQFALIVDIPCANRT